MIFICADNDFYDLEYTEMMKLASSFPKLIMVNDQAIDLSHMSAEEKEFAVRFTDDAILRYERFGRPRALFGIAGPSGAGKSVLAAMLKEIAKEKKLPFRVETVSIDAFHFPNEYLATEERKGVNLKSVKGRYDTYDTQLLAGEFSRFREGAVMRFPHYSRKIHDPIPGAVTIAEPRTLLFIEGLWVLYDHAGWEFVRDELDYAYFLDDAPERLQRHVVGRHIRGGRTERAALQFYKASDLENYRLVMQTKKYADQFFSWPRGREHGKTVALGEC